MAKPTTIAARLFFLVFGCSVAWFTISTAIQMTFEYRHARVEADANLEALYQATQAGLESALWNYDIALARRSLQATQAVGLLSGAQVRDERGAELASWGDAPVGQAPQSIENHSTVEAWAQPLVHRFPLVHRDNQGMNRIVGELILVTDLKILESRLGDSLRLILFNYLATTLVVLVLLLVGLNRRVAGPLKRITRAIEAYRFDRAGLPPLEDKPRRRPDELSVLWKSFESLTNFLKESYLQQRVMSAILEEAAVMALVCDAEGRVLSSNAQARVRLSEGHPGGLLSRLAYGDDSEPLFAEVPALLASGKSWRGELAAHNDQGQVFWLAAALLPLEVPDDPWARWGVMIEDISSKKLTDLYRQERDLAQQATRAKSLFLANLSHEIRTPMNAVVGLTALALDEEVSPRAREYLSQLKRSGAALLGVINDILDFSKLEEGKLELETVSFPVAGLLESVDAMARFRSEEKGLGFSIVSSPLIPPILKGDRLRLQQVLLNLVSNAIKFTEQGKVEVALDFASPLKPEDPGSAFVSRFATRGSELLPPTRPGCFNRSPRSTRQQPGCTAERDSGWPSAASWYSSWEEPWESRVFPGKGAFFGSKSSWTLGKSYWPPPGFPGIWRDCGFSWRRTTGSINWSPKKFWPRSASSLSWFPTVFRRSRKSRPSRSTWS